MHRLLPLAAALLLPLSSQAQDALVITGVIDGPLAGGTPKAVELYVAEDVADLSTYGVGFANNGGGTDGVEFTFPSVAAAAGSFIWIASEATEFQNWFGAPPDYTDGDAAINGNDAVELFYDASGAFSGAETVVDVFGDINTDGNGQPWDYLDGWAYRESYTGPDGATFVLGNWSFSGANALDGETSNATAGTPFPAGTYDPGVDVSQAVYDGAGWRLLSAPVSGLTVGDLAGINLVQGIPAGATNPAEYPSEGANLFTEYTGGDTPASYDAPSDTDEILSPGRGFWWYWYDQDAGPFSGGTSQGYELSSFVLTASGPAETTDVTEAFTNNADDFYMIGNPFPVLFNLFSDAITSSVGTVQTAVYVYDTETATYETRFGLDSANEFPGSLAAWQGAFAQITGTGGADPTVTYDADDATGTCSNLADSCEFTGRVAAEAGLALRLDGTLASGTAVADRAANLRLLDDAEAGWDRHDLSELAAPNAEAAMLALVGERDGEAERQGVLALPTSLAGTWTVPVAFQTTGSGSFEVSWDGAVLPAGWTATLRDLVSNGEADLAVEGSLAFEAAATDWTDRFEIVLASASVAEEGGPEAGFWVGDVYPNPAVGEARLGVRLTAAERVTATVYDALGRAVAVAFDGDLGSGTRTLRVETATLAPGVYVVRLDGETFTRSRRLVVAR